MNSIGVDFKLKNLDLDGTRFKLQIVINKINVFIYPMAFGIFLLFIKYSINSYIKKFSGILQGKRDLEPSQLVIIKELKQLLLFMTSPTEIHLVMSKIGC